MLLEDVKSICDSFTSIFSSTSRCRILLYLYYKGEAGIGEIARGLSLAKPTVSEYLKSLSKAMLVEQIAGRYRLTAEGVRLARALIASYRLAGLHAKNISKGVGRKYFYLSMFEGRSKSVHNADKAVMPLTTLMGIQYACKNNILIKRVYLKIGVASEAYGEMIVNPDDICDVEQLILYVPKTLYQSQLVNNMGLTGLMRHVLYFTLGQTSLNIDNALSKIELVLLDLGDLVRNYGSTVKIEIGTISWPLAIRGYIEDAGNEKIKIMLGGYAMGAFVELHLHLKGDKKNIKSLIDIESSVFLRDIVVYAQPELARNLYERVQFKLGFHWATLQPLVTASLYSARRGSLKPLKGRVLDCKAACSQASKAIDVDNVPAVHSLWEAVKLMNESLKVLQMCDNWLCGVSEEPLIRIEVSGLEPYWQIVSGLTVISIGGPEVI